MSLKNSIVCLLLTILSIGVYGQDLDSVIHIAQTPFFAQLIEKKDLEVNLIGTSKNLITELQNPILRQKHIVCLKTKKGLFIHFSGTGRIYQYIGKTDSTFEFTRLDNTININYNINSYSFSYNNILYNYGGYGFWKSNGLLRKFNVINKEWDIVPLNKEVHLNDEFDNIWKDPNDNKVYVVFEQNMNEGIKSNEKSPNGPSPTSYLLDLPTFTIEKKGTLNELIIPSFQKSSRLHTDEGIMLIRVPNSYYLKLKENTLYSIEDPSIIQSLGRLSYENISYFQHGKFYFWDFKKNIYDSIDVKNIKLKPIGKIWSDDNSAYYYVVGIIVLLAAALFVFKNRKKKNEKVISFTNDKGNIVHVSLISETEIALIRLLMEKSEQNESASSNEINYIIGCKDKNVGLQKKMRSDIINSINTKYKAFSKTELNLIESRRTDYDKRYFHYHISVDQLEKAKLFVELTAVEA